MPSLSEVDENTKPKKPTQLRIYNEAVKKKPQKEVVSEKNFAINMEENAQQHPIVYGQNAKEVKEFCQCVYNTFKGIAFNSRSNRFKYRQHDFTPGPGQYQEGLKLKSAGVKILTAARDTNWLVEHNKVVGPGTYFKEESLVKPSYNVTLPHNILDKRREELVQSKLLV